MKQSLKIALMITVILSVIIPVTGKVFWRRGFGHGISALEKIPGWERVYQAPVRINQGSGKVQIIGCRENPGQAMNKLRNIFKAEDNQAVFRQNKSSGWGIIHAGNRVIRVLVLDPGTGKKTIVFILTQSLLEYKKSIEPPEEHQMNDIFVYPDSSVQSFIMDETSRTSMEISKAHGIPSEIHSFFTRTLAGHGYRLMSPYAEPIGTIAFTAVYQKRFDIYCLYVRNSDCAGESVITILHKRLRME